MIMSGSVQLPLRKDQAIRPERVLVLVLSKSMHER